MNPQTRLLASTLCAFAGLTMSAAAQTQVRAVIASGGTAAASGGTVLVGTIGQSIIGPAGAPNAGAGQGFWYAIELNAPSAVDGAIKMTEGTAALSCSPNPCSAGTTIRIHVPRSGRVRLALFDALGHEVRTIIAEHHEAGTINLPLATADLVSGNYVARLDAPGAHDAIRIVVVK